MAINNTQVQADDLLEDSMMEDEEIPAIKKTPMAAVERIMPRPIVQKKQQEAPRFVSFNQTQRAGIIDTYTNKVFSEDIFEILAYICSKVDKIERSLE
jgi:hypothetical protein